MEPTQAEQAAFYADIEADRRNRDTAHVVVAVLAEEAARLLDQIQARVGVDMLDYAMKRHGYSVEPDALARARAGKLNPLIRFTH
jgi:hypothetical protein